MSRIRPREKIIEIELVFRGKTKASTQPLIEDSKDAYGIFRKVWDDRKIELQEEIKVMLLDRRNSCLGVASLSMGGLTECLLDVRLIFALALKARATAIILAHNHPSGNLIFSDDDKEQTHTLADAGKLLDIQVLDHLLVSKEGYVSFCDKGLFSSSGRGIFSIFGTGKFSPEGYLCPPFAHW